MEKRETDKSNSNDPVKGHLINDYKHKSASPRIIF